MFGDDFMLALCLWREARGEGAEGMHAVANVIVNRVKGLSSSVYQEVVRPWQFSSITAHEDPELGLYPTIDDPQWTIAIGLAQGALAGSLDDITNGAKYYFNPGVVRPSWAQGMHETVQIGHHVFYKP